MKVKLNGYIYEKSSRPSKKLMVSIDGKKIHFGDNTPGTQHYFDKTGLLKKNLNHLNKKRRDSYRLRHSGVLLKNGKKAINDPSQPAFHALKILW